MPEVTLSEYTSKKRESQKTQGENIHKGDFSSTVEQLSVQHSWLLTQHQRHDLGKNDVHCGYNLKALYRKKNKKL